MKVTALKAGFFGGVLREQGVTFEVPDGTKSTWFAATDTEQSKAAKPPKPKAEQPKALSELAAPGKAMADVLA